MLKLVAFVFFVCYFSSSFATANWRGPYDTQTPADLWLRSVMEKTPRKDFIIENEQDGFNIMNFGAVPSVRSQNASIQNGLAFYNAVLAANNSRGAPTRTVIIPAGYNFWYLPHGGFQNLVNITFQFNGNISAYPDNFTAWISCLGDTRCAVVEIVGGSDITFVGNGGIIDGFGFKWWVEQFKPHKEKNMRRPKLIQVWNVQRLVVDHMGLYNSPYYHFMSHYCVGVLIQYSRVEVNIFEQYQLHKKYGTLLHEGIDLPLTFPLNTDGFDLLGQHIVVRNCHVENFDDSYCPKPQTATPVVFPQVDTGCSQNMLIMNSTIHYGVGSSIGSVGPATGINCIRNITFDHITFTTPIKAIYVKPNPGNSGYGIVHDITYKNIVAYQPVWWGIYVATQQQDQPGPDGANTGCSFFWPLPNTTCPYQPRVPVTNLFLDNVTMIDSLLSPGVLGCNDTYVGPGSGPCTGWVWNNVQTTSLLKWPMGDHFLCHAIEKPIWNNVSSTCIYNMSQSDMMFKNNRKYQNIFNKLDNNNKKHHRRSDPDVKDFLDELVARMKSRGISLWSLMNKHKK